VRALVFIGAGRGRSTDADDRLSSPGSDARDSRHVDSAHTASCVVLAGRSTRWPSVFLAERGSHVSLLRVGTWGRVLTRGPSFSHLTCLNLRVRVHQLFFAPKTVRRLPVPAGFLLSSSSRAPDPVVRMPAPEHHVKKPAGLMAPHGVAGRRRMRRWAGCREISRSSRADAKVTGLPLLYPSPPPIFPPPPMALAHAVLFGHVASAVQITCAA